MRELGAHPFLCATQFRWKWGEKRGKTEKRIGAGDGIRTHDVQLGKLTLYH